MILGKINELNFEISDCKIFYDFIKADNHTTHNVEKKQIDEFNMLKESTNWKHMYHNGNSVPRLITQQYLPAEHYLPNEQYLTNELYEPNKQYLPIYRHPVDYQLPHEPFDEFTKQLAEQIEEKLNLPYKLNHVLIQQYRSGSDFIGEHADKTLDIKPNTSIINYTLGATRYLHLKSKQNKSYGQYVALKNNSLFILGLDTNKHFYHAIKPDKRPNGEKSNDEKSFDGVRISYTFRCINTFLRLTPPTKEPTYDLIREEPTHDLIREEPTYDLIGQGAPTYDLTDKNDYKKMIDAFGIENYDYNFHWNTHYGNGFFALDTSEK